MQRHPNLSLTETEEVQETLLTAPSESQIAGAGEGDSPRLSSHAPLTKQTLTSHALAAFASPLKLLYTMSMYAESVGRKSLHAVRDHVHADSQAVGQLSRPNCTCYVDFSLC